MGLTKSKLLANTADDLSEHTVPTLQDELSRYKNVSLYLQLKNEE